MSLRLDSAGQLWRQMAGGDWYTVEEIEPGLYRYVYSATVPQPDGPAAGQAQEGDGIGDQAVCVAVPGEVTSKGSLARDVTPVAQAPAHNGAGGLAGDSETQPEEPESLERLLGPVGRTSEREG